ncbi:hypothetical protein LCGC14_1390270 [marine sediment metagenome]|uniref:Ribbon-helix-helix protein CopG domain-containing protein n=1 Tax=marine sediment metagenome TaxID=412755 RepID=A0A0F9K066_9ZZZZ
MGKIITIYITDTQEKLIQKIMKDVGFSRSELIRSMINMYLIDLVEKYSILKKEILTLQLSEIYGLSMKDINNFTKK